MKEEFTDVILLTKSDGFAHGLCAGKKMVRTYPYSDEKTTKYLQGDILIFDWLKVWEISDLNIEWTDLVQPYIPTFMDKVKKFFGKDYPKTIRVRPQKNSIVIARCNCGREYHYEVCEYNEVGSWITEFYFPSQPDQWAYIPKECLEAALNKSK